MDHVLPFQRSTSGALLFLVAAEAPTAKQLFTLVHDTTSRWLFLARAGLGLGMVVQDFPFQRAVNVVTRLEMWPLEASPTAMHAVALTHETPAN